MTGLKDIIERLEKAEGPSREMDARIWLALFDKPIMTDGGGFGPKTRKPTYASAREVWPDGWPHWNEPTQVDAVAMALGCPPYTSSIDAALTLVPEGFDAQVIWRGASAPTHCRGGAVVSQPTKSWSKKDRGEICATSHHKATPALALCIAALRASAALRPLPEPPK